MILRTGSNIPLCTHCVFFPWHLKYLRMSCFRLNNGFDYFLSGVEILHHHPTYLQSITKCLYPEIAKIHKTTNSCVERDIRTVIEVLWKNGCNSLFTSEIFSHKSYPASGKRPTNTQFFEMVMAYMEASAAASLLPCGSDTCKNCPVINSLHAELSALQEENQ